MRRANYERESETVAFSGFLNAERQRILAAATPERRAQMEAAEESRAVYRAWNAVCSGTREGRHVTGLRYLPESNELLVYLDSPSWTQEMTLLREIIRARMERAGAHVDGLVFKTTAPGHTPPAAKERLRPATTERPPAPHADLSEAERTEIERQVAHRGPKTARGPRERHESQCRVGQGRAKQKRALNRIWWPCRAKYPRSRGYFFTIN